MKISWLCLTVLLLAFALVGSGVATGQPRVTLNPPAQGATQLSGHAFNVDFSRIKVVVYVLTNQWYVQPSTNAPFTNINPDGSWSCFTNPWDKIVVLLVDPANYKPADTETTNPALDPNVLAWTNYPVEPISVNFSGRTWGIKVTGDSFSSYRFDPGPNYWSSDPSVVHVANDGLHLKNQQIDGKWRAGEIYLTESLGYGTYRVQISSHLDQLDQNTVAAPLFIYTSPTQELDNEYSGMGGLISAPYNAQFVVQPFTVQGNLFRYLQPSTSQFTSRMIWHSDRVVFTTWQGWSDNPQTGDIIDEWTYTGAYIPPVGHERVHINLWLLGGNGPLKGVGDEMVINAFSFQPSYGLTVTNLFGGGGTITSSDGAINCGAVCFAYYDASTDVTLTATPAQGWVFDAWSGCDATQANVCMLTMNNTRAVSAEFLATLSVSKSGNGTVTSSDGGINCGSVCTANYVKDRPITLTANPDAGWVFSSWSGCDTTRGNGCTVSMTNGRNVTANFKATLSVSKSGNGTVVSGDGAINCGATCSASYTNGTAVTLTATAAQGWVFQGWTGCDSSQGNVCNLTMNSGRNVTATFFAALIISRIGNGLVASDDGAINCGNICNANYASGTVVTLTATPAQGWALTNWTGCDTVHGNVCTVTMNSGRNVKVTFTITYPLTVSISGSGTVTSADGYINCGSGCSHNYPNGTQVSLTATPATGFTLSGWSGCDSTNGNICTVNIGGPRSVMATFTVAQVVLQSLTFKPPAVAGGLISIGTLSLTAPAPLGGVSVGLQSSNRLAVVVPVTVFVAGGSSSVRFVARTIPVRGKTVVTVTASANTSSTAGTLTVNAGRGAPLQSAHQ